MPVRLVAAFVLGVLASACRSNDTPPPEPAPAVVEAPRDAAPALAPDPYLETRLEMVARTIENRDDAPVVDPRVLTAMRLTPRHEFVPPAIRSEAYEDRPLPIGFGLTISQPYIVALMTAAARVKPGDRVLEIGTGSGYQAAVLALMGAKVYTIELHEELAARTAKVLARTGFTAVNMKIGDGWYGWPDVAPFDAILVTCATPVVPDRLVQQLKVGGRLVAPIGDDYGQSLEVVTKTADGINRRALMEVRFGPMLGVVEAER